MEELEEKQNFEIQKFALEGYLNMIGNATHILSDRLEKADNYEELEKIVVELSYYLDSANKGINEINIGESASKDKNK